MVSRMFFYLYQFFLAIVQKLNNFSVMSNWYACKIFDRKATWLIVNSSLSRTHHLHHPIRNPLQGQRSCQSGSKKFSTRTDNILKFYQKKWIFEVSSRQKMFKITTKIGNTLVHLFMGMRVIYFLSEMPKNTFESMEIYDDMFFTFIMIMINNCYMYLPWILTRTN